MFDEHLINGNQAYPLVQAFQTYFDDRGAILNIADGDIGDVAIIKSEAGSIRASHFHNKDWHLCYLVQGQFKYIWKDSIELKSKSLLVESGQSVVTPPLIPHKFEFIQKSIMVVVSQLSRLEINYERDTVRLDPLQF
jgi:dTDP-4-dehydrorhamnose 3,5-epimerase-like enzyme